MSTEHPSPAPHGAAPESLAASPEPSTTAADPSTRPSEATSTPAADGLSEAATDGSNAAGPNAAGPNAAGPERSSTDEPTSDEQLDGEPTSDVAGADETDDAPVTDPLATAEPEITRTASSDPEGTDIGTAEPVATEAVTAGPVTAEPAPSGAATTDPVSADPVSTDPVSTEPATAEPDPTAAPSDSTAENVGLVPTTTSPKPGPARVGRPVPRPVPEPASSPATAPTSQDRTTPASQQAADQEVPTVTASALEGQWGRIDTGGTVYVRTGDSERAIGSWQAGDAAAGLAYYERRYADLVTEVNLLQSRLDSGAAEAKATWAQVAALQESLPDAAVIGDLSGLSQRLGVLRAGAEAKLAEHLLSREQDRSSAIAAKQALVTEAEEIAESSTQWKSAGDRMRAIVDDWKKIKGVDRRTDERLWKRYAAARDAFGHRRGQHFAGMDAERTSAKAEKEALIARAQKLSDSSDWRETAEAMKRLMTEWKATARASKSDEDALWTRFRAAQDAFFARRSETFAERDAGELANQQTKEAIIAEAAAIDLGDPRRALQRLAALGDRFDEVGHVPRDAMRRLDEGMQAAERRVRDAVDSARPAPAAGPTNPFLVAMVARLTEAQAKLEQARRSGNATRIAKAEAEVESRRALLPADAEPTVVAPSAVPAGEPVKAKAPRNQWTGPAQG